MYSHAFAMINRALLYIVLFCLAFLLLAWYFSNIFIYIIISMVIATILKPLTNYLNKAQLFDVRFSKIISILLSFSVAIAVISAFIFLFVPLISEQIKVFSDINIEQVLSVMAQPFKWVEHVLISNGLVNQQEGFLIESVKNSLYVMVGNIQYSEIINQLVSLTGNVFIGVIAVIFITFFLLYEDGIMRRMFISQVPNHYFEMMVSGFFKVEKLLSNYLLGLFFQMISIFTIAFIGLSILGVKYSATIALFAAVTNLVPYLGPVLGATFGVFVGISTSPELFSGNAYLFLVIKLVSVFAVVQLVDNLVLQPLIFSKSVKAHPLEIFIVIFAGANLAGIAGMIAAIPVYTVLRVSFLEIKKAFRSYRIFKL